MLQLGEIILLHCFHGTLYLKLHPKSFRKLPLLQRQSRLARPIGTKKEIYVLLNLQQFLLMRKLDILLVKPQEKQNVSQRDLEHLERFNLLILRPLKKRIQLKNRKKSVQQQPCFSPLLTFNSHALSTSHPHPPPQAKEKGGEFKKGHNKTNNTVSQQAAHNSTKC